MVHIWGVKAPNDGLSFNSLIMHISNNRLTNKARGLIFGTQGPLWDQNILALCDPGSKVIDLKYHNNAYFQVPLSATLFILGK